MIELKGLTKRYGNFVAVDNLNLLIPKGEIFGFIGPNGAGKTTTINMINNLFSCPLFFKIQQKTFSFLNKKEKK